MIIFGPISWHLSVGKKLVKMEFYGKPISDVSNGVAVYKIYLFCPLGSIFLLFFFPLLKAHGYDIFLNGYQIFSQVGVPFGQIIQLLYLLVDAD
jgi:hypothetical protein